MASEKVFESCVRSAGDLAGVFEYDGETGYFYLCATGAAGEARVLEAIHVLSGEASFAASDIAIEWDPSETRAGLTIRGQLRASFDTTNMAKLGGTPVKPFQAEEEMNLGVITTSAVLAGAPILLVSHDADDGGWQFLCGTTSDPADGRIVHVREILATDPTVVDVADLPPGWVAFRGAVGGEWTREPA